MKKQLLTLIAQAKSLPVAEQVDLYNACTQALAEMLGWPHPVLAPQLVPSSQVVANDYNPNKVAPPEMALLKLSIKKDGVTMPVVACEKTVIKNDREILESLHGYIPVVQLKKPLEERIAATVRHNMARGAHVTELSAKLILMLKDHNWTDARIGKELGMQPDEVLRLKQITGLAEAFKDHEFSKAWEAKDE